MLQETRVSSPSLPYSKPPICAETNIFLLIRHLDIPLILIIPRQGPISSNALEKILPDQVKYLMLRPHPTIPNRERRAMACAALNWYIAKRPWLDEDREKHLVAPDDG